MGYLAIAILGAGVIYPVFGHWAWGGLLSGTPTGWLEKAGFIDFAGSTVVHSIGGWIALSAVLVIGPRLGRFSRKRDRFRPGDLSLSIAGAFFLWIGWFGFNGGSVLAFDESVPGVLLNTLMAPAAGGLAVMTLFILRNRRPEVPSMINGVLAGLVAVTANCHIVSIHDALIIGAVGGLICLAAQKLLDYFCIDDAVSAIPVHLAAGIWGTLAVALFGDLSAFHDGAGRWDQLLIQLQGVGAAAVYAFGISYVGRHIINLIYPLRVSAREEMRGLDASEHGHESAMQTLLDELEMHARNGSLTRSVSVEPNTRAGVVAQRYNRVLKRFRAETAEKENLVAALRIEKQRAEVANSAKTQFLMNISHELLTPLNAIVGFSEVLRNLVGAERSKPSSGDIAAKQADYLSEIEVSGRHLHKLIRDVLDFTQIDVNSYELNESAFDLLALTQDVCAARLPQAEAARRNIQLEFDPALPCLFADKRAIQQVLLNIISNAVKFTDDDGRIAIRAFESSQGQINMRIADDGAGIPREQLAAVALPFRQVTRSGGYIKPEGLGLGLSIASALVEIHGGTLSISSFETGGTEVAIQFPASRTSRDTASGEQDRATIPA